MPHPREIFLLTILSVVLTAGFSRAQADTTPPEIEPITWSNATTPLDGSTPELLIAACGSMIGMNARIVNEPAAIQTVWKVRRTNGGPAVEYVASNALQRFATSLTFWFWAQPMEYEFELTATDAAGNNTVRTARAKCIVPGQEEIIPEFHPDPDGDNQSHQDSPEPLKNFFNPGVESVLVHCDGATEIYSQEGNIVRSLACAGETAEWDGRGDGGDRVVSGIYYYQALGKLFKLAALK